MAVKRYDSATSSWVTVAGVGSQGPAGANGSDGSAPLTTKGDLLTRSSTAVTRLGVGTNGFVLTADSAEATGIKWAVVNSASMTELASGSFPTNASTLTISSIAGGYRDLRIVCKNVRTGVDGDNVHLRMNGNTGSVYFDNLFIGEGATNATPGTTLRFLGSIDNTAANNLVVGTIYEYESTTWKLASSIFITPNSSTDTNGRGQAYQGGANLTSAVTSITLWSENTSNFAAGTYVLYGVK